MKNIIFLLQKLHLLVEFSDFKTIDKLCTINTSFNEFIETVDKLINADKGYFELTKNKLENLCDKKLKNNEIMNYCKEKNIPFEMDDFE